MRGSRDASWDQRENLEPALNIGIGEQRVKTAQASLDLARGTFPQRIKGRDRDLRIGNERAILVRPVLRDPILDVQRGKRIPHHHDQRTEPLELIKHAVAPPAVENIDSVPQQPSEFIP